MAFPVLSMKRAAPPFFNRAGESPPSLPSQFPRHAPQGQRSFLHQQPPTAVAFSLENMNELHLFAGAGGGILAGQLLGHRTVCAVEWEPYAQAVLVARQNDGTIPPFPIWDDVLKSHIITSRENGKWTRNINTALSATASFAGRRLLQEIRIRRSNAAPMPVAGRCKHARLQKHARFVGSIFCRQDLNMKLAHGNAEQFFGCPNERLTPWSKSGGGLPCSAAASSLDASETKRIGLQRCSAIQLSPFGRISNPISNLACHGPTMARGLTHGA